MSEFRVELAEMRQLVRDLNDCADELEHGLNALRDIGPKGLGYDFFDDACEHFQDRWDDGLGKIRDSVKGVHGGLKKVMENYEKTEHHAIESMKPSSGGKS